jgi:DNA-binding winged helix-turn-helix (wHTH) protein
MVDPGDSAKVYLFEDFRLDRNGGGLFRRSGVGLPAPVPLGWRALDLLSVLVEHHGSLISREKIMAAVWPRVVVEESNLTVQISTLRRVLDHGRAGGSCIQTVPGRGYRFVLEVTTLDKEASPPHAEACPAGAESEVGAAPPNAGIADTPRLSIAVLPFNNLGGSRAEDYLADALTEDLTTESLAPARCVSDLAPFGSEVQRTAS